MAQISQTGKRNLAADFLQNFEWEFLAESAGNAKGRGLARTDVRGYDAAAVTFFRAADWPHKGKQLRHCRR